MHDKIAFVKVMFQSTPFMRNTKYKFFINLESAQQYANTYLNDDVSWVVNVGLCEILDNGNIVPVEDDEEEVEE